jgi:Domain of unknown function (DUF4276)
VTDRRVHLLVEGQTEEILVREVIQPYLEDNGWLVSSSILVTKRIAGGSNHRGGVTNWARLAREIQLLLRDTNLDALTTVIDYYRFPDDAPGTATRPPGDAYQRVEHVEEAVAEAIGDRRFVPHLTLHEAETWVFAAAEQLGEWCDDPALADRMKADVACAGGPELINDGPTTAPSKRLLGYRPSYLKTLDDPAAVAELGLPELRLACPHLDRWLIRLLGT